MIEISTMPGRLVDIIIVISVGIGKEPCDVQVAKSVAIDGLLHDNTLSSRQVR